MTKRFVMIVAAMALTLGVGTRQAQATTITFDSPISNLAGTDSSLLPLGIDYLPNPSPNITLTTQGFDFGGIGSRPDGSDGQQDVFVALDPTQCPAILGIAQPCANNGTHYGNIDRGISLMPSVGGLFSLNSIDAGGAFGPGGCPAGKCNGSFTPDATQLDVRGYRGGVLVAEQILALSFGFHTFALNNDVDWGSIDRAVFQPVNDPTGLRTNVAFDNITVNAVPEPATLTLTALGLAAAVRARRRRR